MRIAISLLCVLMLAGLAAAGEDEAQLERLRLLRTAAEAKLKLGDALRENGDIEGAIREYRAATELLNQALAPKRDVAKRILVKPEVRVVIREQPGSVSDAVAAGLKWLAAHQDLDSGRWDADEFMKQDKGGDVCDGAGGALYDVGVSGLAVLAFLGAGHSDRGNPYAANVRQGLQFLRTVQDDEGCFGTRATMHFMYNHALATLAMCEAFALTKNPIYKKHAQEGLDFLAKARNPYMAWRYQPRGGENDTSVTNWCVLALRSGQSAGLDVDPDAFAGARAWIEKVTDPEFGNVGYNRPGGSCARPEGLQDEFPPERSQSMTAAGILTRILCGEDPRKSAVIQKGARLCLERLPEWEPGKGSIDMYYWHLGTLALFQVGGEHWRKWNGAMKDAILKHQHGAGARAGSWDPLGPWGPDGGRVYATALMTMCLQN